MLASMTRRAKTAVGVLALVVLAGGVGYVVVSRHQAAQPIALPVDRETTHITEPLGPDGRVDFAAALNAGPIPAAEENAAIPLTRIVGTDVLIGDFVKIRALLREILRTKYEDSFLPDSAWKNAPRY